MDINEGENIGGYTILKHIGKGSEANVYLVRSLKYDQLYAAKILSGQKKCQDTEINALLSLVHPNIVSLYNYFYYQNKLVMVMDYCPGGTLQEEITQNGPMNRKTFTETAYQLLSALKEMHSQNIAHHDIKPSNILRDQYGRVKFSDFGISIIRETSQCTSYSCSTLFASPEVLKCVPHDPFAADIWALGVTFHFLLSGTYPYDLGDIDIRRTIMCGFQYIERQIRRDFRCIIEIMMKINPEKRPTVDCLLSMPIFKEFAEGLQHHNPSIRRRRASGIASASSLLSLVQLQKVQSSKLGPRRSTFMDFTDD